MAKTDIRLKHFILTAIIIIKFLSKRRIHDKKLGLVTDSVLFESEANIIWGERVTVDDRSMC